ncbi:unnamed protein product, partial [Pylaiella littoralis]
MCCTAANWVPTRLVFYCVLVIVFPWSHGKTHQHRMPTDPSSSSLTRTDEANSPSCCPPCS